MPSLVILVSAVLVLSCVQTESQPRMIAHATPVGVNNKILQRAFCAYYVYNLDGTDVSDFIECPAASSLPDFVVNVDSINIFKNRLDRLLFGLIKILCLIIQLNLPESEINQSL